MALHLDGRDFLPPDQQLPAAQDDWVQSYIRPCSYDLIAASEFDPEEKAALLYRKIEEAGVKQQIMAGLLTEVGTRWTRESAQKNAERFDQITNPTEKQLMRDSVLVLVAGFFLSGKESSRTSPKSSNRKKPGRDTSNGASR